MPHFEVGKIPKRVVEELASEAHRRLGLPGDQELVILRVSLECEIKPRRPEESLAWDGSLGWPSDCLHGDSEEEEPL